jgi:hypothetical protein
MVKNEKNDDSSVNPSVQNEIAAFQSDEMILCKKCSRKSPPNRMQCFYCGEHFEISEVQSDLIKPNLRKLEAWENGFNLIYLAKQREINETETRKISNLLNLEKDFLNKLFENGEFLPIIRLESLRDVEIVKEKLSKKGLETTIVKDDKLDLKNPLRRLRKIELEDEKIKLTLFNKAETIEIAREDLVLIISGSIYEKTQETVEKYIKSKENKTLSVDETAKDEKIVDIYSRNDLRGFRILTNGFDFSCLGNEMSFLAFENIVKIFEKLKLFAPNARAVENYNKIRNLVGEIWEIEAINQSRGVSKKGIGNFNLNKATIITNINQFTRFSRLQRHLL